MGARSPPGWQGPVQQSLQCGQSFREVTIGSCMAWGEPHSFPCTVLVLGDCVGVKGFWESCAFYSVSYKSKSVLTEIKAISKKVK